MSGSSLLSAAQIADAIARDRDGRPDKAAMSNEERRAAGLMDRRQAAEHERLATLPHTRLADRVKGPAPDDIWADAKTWMLVLAAGHWDCGGWTRDGRDLVLVCACGEVLAPKGDAG